MRIFITGGAGYIGTGLVRLLAADSRVSRVIVYDNLSLKNFGLFTQGRLAGNDKISFIQGDILDSRSLRSLLKDADAVIHLAAKVTTPFANDDLHQYDQVNHWGTAEVTYAVEQNEIKTFIYLSSAAVYGYSDTLLTETAAPQPATAYGKSKLNGEKHVQRLIGAGCPRTLILRSGNVFGYNPSMRFDTVINRFIFEAEYFKRVYVHGSGTQERPFICVHNLVQTIAGCLFATALHPGVYNVFTYLMQVNSIVALLKELYPSLEVQYVEQQFNMGSLRIEKNSVIEALGTQAEHSMLKDMQELRNQFAF